MPGRNEPCPCGSGKKYKKCCQRRAARNDSLLRRWETLVFAIHEELRVTYPEEALREWTDRLGIQPLEDEEVHFCFEFLALSHPLETGLTPAETYIEDGSRFEDSDDTFELDCLTLPLSIYEITDQTGPSEFILCDLLRNKTPHNVNLGRPDQVGLSVGDSVLARLFPDADNWFPVSIHPRGLTEGAGDWLAGIFLKHRKSCHSSTLMKPESSRELYHLWNAAVEKTLVGDDEGTSEFVNFDGERISLSREIWTFAPKKRKWLLQGLLAVEGLEQTAEDSFVYGTEERSLMGFVTLKEHELWIDANSFERLNQISEAILGHCRDLLTFEREVGHDEIVASTDGSSNPENRLLGETKIRELLKDPDIRAQLEAQLPEGVTFDHLLKD